MDTKLSMCRGAPCDKLFACTTLGSCQYVSSGDEARKAREVPKPPPFTLPPGRIVIHESETAVVSSPLPCTPKERKEIPVATGVLDYFPAALVAIARLSQAGNDKHNPGEPLHWARGKSTDHADCLARHFLDRGTIDPEDGISHTVKVAWRALALLQEELEAQGAPKPRGAR